MKQPRKAPQTTPRDKLLYVRLDELRPTQIAVGMRAVAAKGRKLGPSLTGKKRMLSFLGRRPLPVIRGPGGSLYLIDKHHLGLALVRQGIENVFVEVIDDLSHLRPAAFWASMEAEGRAYLFDARGERVRPSRLPRRLDQLRADPYRDLAWEAREAGLFKKVRVPFSEFRWAAFFRARIEERTVSADYTRALKMAARLSTTRAASSLPGYLH